MTFGEARIIDPFDDIIKILAQVLLTFDIGMSSARLFNTGSSIGVNRAVFLNRSTQPMSTQPL